jgi:succinate dehydrogenase/fumarate reductase flavoprotein subunit
MYDVIVIGSGIAGLTATKQLLQSKRGLAIADIEAASPRRPSPAGAPPH